MLYIGPAYKKGILMIENYIRNSFERVLIDPIVAQMKQSDLRNITPNAVTCLALFFGVLSSIFIANNLTIVAICALLFSGFFDILDGAFARQINRVSNFGAGFDIVSDRIVEASIVLGFYYLSPQDRGDTCLLMLSAILICVTSFLVVGIFSQNTSQKSFHYSQGLMERPEAFFFFFIMTLFPAYFFIFGLIFSILVMFTGLFRMWQFRKCSSTLLKP